MAFTIWNPNKISFLLSRDHTVGGFYFGSSRENIIIYFLKYCFCVFLFLRSFHESNTNNGGVRACIWAQALNMSPAILILMGKMQVIPVYSSETVYEYMCGVTETGVANQHIDCVRARLCHTDIHIHIHLHNYTWSISSTIKGI